MKKNLLWLVAVFLLAAVWSPLNAENQRFALKITGGVSRLFLGDVNAYIQDASRYRIDDLKSVGYSTQRNFERFHAGQEFEITAMLAVSKNLSLTVSSGIIQSKKDNNTFGQESSFSILSNTFDHTVRAVPLTVGMNYKIPVSSGSRFFFSFGGGLYFSKFLEKGTYEFESKKGHSGSSRSWNADLKAVGLGGFAGAGFEIDIGKGFSLLVESRARYARISGFSGDLISRYNNFPDTENIKLYYYEFYSAYLQDTYKTFNLPFLWPGYELRVLREAVIDLSGISLKAGIKIKL